MSFVLLFSTFCNHLDGEARAGCFALIVFLMYCDSQCSVAFPRRKMGLSAVCDCGISSLYSLVFDKKLKTKNIITIIFTGLFIEYLNDIV